jgi:hypothetical protein
MLPANKYVLRLATEHDAADLRRLAQLDEASPLTGRILIGELHGAAAAALSLKTGRAVADPFLPTADLRIHLRTRASALEAVSREPSLRERMLDAVRTAAPVRSMG